MRSSRRRRSAKRRARGSGSRCPRSSPPCARAARRTNDSSSAWPRCSARSTIARSVAPGWRARSTRSSACSSSIGPIATSRCVERLGTTTARGSGVEERRPPEHGDVASQGPSSADGFRLSHGDSLPNAAPYVARTKRWALVAVVVVSFALAAWVAAPLWVAILLGVIMATSTHQIFVRLVRKFGERRAPWVAAVLTFASGLLVAVLGALILFTLTNELMKLVDHVGRHEQSGSLAGIIGERGSRAIAELGVDTERLYAWARKELEAAASYAATLAAHRPHRAARAPSYARAPPRGA